MALQAGSAAPYAPPATMIEVIDRYRDRGLTLPITTEVLERAGVPESLSQRTLQALRLLNFIDAEGNPSSELERLSRAPEGEWQQGLQEMLTAAYGEVFKFVDLSKDGIDRVRDAFRPFNPRGQQERMVTLFLGLCEWAGMDVTAAAASRKKPGGVADANGKVKARPARRSPTVVKTDKHPPQRQRAQGSTAGASDLPPGLVGLLQEVPRDGKGWTEDTRDRFIDAFTAVLNFTVPLRPIGLEDLTDDDLVHHGDTSGDEP